VNPPGRSWRMSSHGEVRGDQCSLHSATCRFLQSADQCVVFDLDHSLGREVGGWVAV
jgi:hypothetical protein